MRLKLFVLIITLLSVGLAASPNRLVLAINHEGQHEGDHEGVPATIKAAFPNAEIKKQHKDLTPSQISSIEKGSGSKLNDTDVHTFVAYGTESGKHTQLGAATVADVSGAGEPIQLAIIYTNDITIKKIAPIKGSSDVTYSTFLDQFAGKDHDQPFHVGQDIEYSGKNKNAAEAVAHALKRDILTMQMLYGNAHSH